MSSGSRVLVRKDTTPSGEDLDGFTISVIDDTQYYSEGDREVGWVVNLPDINTQLIQNLLSPAKRHSHPWEDEYQAPNEPDRYVVIANRDWRWQFTVADMLVMDLTGEITFNQSQVMSRVHPTVTASNYAFSPPS